jgi:catechol 2,3-dioxygenase-like lactoylglutathione lyase family enzyme
MMLLKSVVPVLMSRDITTSLAFYQKLGFAVDFQDDPAHPRYAGIARDGVELHLQWQDPAHWNNHLDRPIYRFPVRELERLYLEFQASGALPATSASPWHQPGPTPWGTTEFHLRDPDHNALQFYR